MRMLAVSAVIALVAVLGAFSVQAVTLQPGDLVVTRPPFLSKDIYGAIIHIDPHTGVKTVISLVDDPQGIAIDANGDLFVSDWGPYCSACPNPPDAKIIRIDLATGAQSVIVAFPYWDNVQPRHIAIDASGNLFVTQRFGIFRIDPATRDVTVVATYPYIIAPTSIVIDEYGDLIVVARISGEIARTVVRIDPETGAHSEIVKEDLEGGRFNGIAIDPYGDLLLTVLAPRKRLCFGGSNDGNPCSNIFDCRPGGSCRIVDEQESFILRVDPETGD